VLDGLAAPVLLLDQQRRPVHLNCAAERMLAGRGRLRRVRGRIEAVTPAATRALDAALTRAGSEAAIGRMGLEIPVPDPGGGGHVLHLLPLLAGHLRPALAPLATAAVFVATAAAPRPAPSAALSALFDLTLAEARVVALLAEGRSAPGIAVGLGLRPSTVKTHLIRIFEKTGARGQAELRVILAGLASPLAPRQPPA
jgi:DNA-binding CsgD family transcriptional regulator